MDFRKKLKIRLWVSIVYMVLGVALIVTSFIVKSQNNFASSFGFAIAVIGVARLRNHFIITKNDESIKKREIAEKDERMVFIADKAKSVTFLIYLVVSCLAVIVVNLLELTLISRVLSASVCFLLVVYWISYLIIAKKS